MMLPTSPSPSRTRYKTRRFCSLLERGVFDSPALANQSSSLGRHYCATEILRNGRRKQMSFTEAPTCDPTTGISRLENETRDTVAQTQLETQLPLANPTWPPDTHSPTTARDTSRCWRRKNGTTDLTWASCLVCGSCQPGCWYFPTKCMSEAAAERGLRTSARDT